MSFPEYNKFNSNAFYPLEFKDNQIPDDFLKIPRDYYQ